MRCAVLFGVVLAFAVLAFLGLVKDGTNLWFTLPKNPGWLDGSLWWVAVTAAAGVLGGVISGLPEALAFTTMFAALPGSLVAAPFSLILLGALTTRIGTLQTAPIAIAVLTAYLAVSGTGVLLALARRQAKPASGP